MSHVLFSVKQARSWLVLFGTLVLLVAARSGALIKAPLFCPLRIFTGIPCGSCGLTRAIDALCHRDWAAAIHYHPASPLLLLAWIGTALLSCAELVMKRNFLGPLWSRWGSTAVWLTVVTVLIGWSINLAAYFGNY